MTNAELEREVKELSTKLEETTKELQAVYGKYRLALEEVELNRNVLKAIGKLAK